MHEINGESDFGKTVVPAGHTQLCDVISVSEIHMQLSRVQYSSHTRLVTQVSYSTHGKALHFPQKKKPGHAFPINNVRVLLYGPDCSLKVYEFIISVHTRLKTALPEKYLDRFSSPAVRCPSLSNLSEKTRVWTYNASPKVFKVFYSSSLLNSTEIDQFGPFLKENSCIKVQIWFLVDQMIKFIQHHLLHNLSNIRVGLCPTTSKQKWESKIHKHHAWVLDTITCWDNMHIESCTQTPI